jgi:hypothetical protein
MPLHGGIHDDHGLHKVAHEIGHETMKLAMGP